jgi:hypothetical protein
VGLDEFISIGAAGRRLWLPPAGACLLYSIPLLGGGGVRYTTFVVIFATICPPLTETPVTPRPCNTPNTRELFVSTWYLLQSLVPL